MPRGGQRVVGRVIVGAIALVVFGLALLATVQAVRAKQVYRAAPACTLASTGPDCRGTLDQTVSGIDIKAGKHPAPSVELPGGWVILDDDAASFAAGLSEGQTVAAEVWHGNVVSVTAHGETFQTSDSPSTNWAARVAFAGICFAIGFLVLRSASLTRLWKHLGYQTSGGPELRAMHWFSAAVFAAGVVGLLLTAFGLLIGLGFVVLAVVALLYGLAVPTLIPTRGARF
jgi:hypothetical protein